MRLHLDDLPIDYNLDVPGDRFLARLAFMFARQRYACADSLTGSGFGGPVIGGLARSLLSDGLRWQWVGSQPERRRTLLGDLLEERNRVCVTLEKFAASCSVLSRWLMPLPDVADLTGASMSWLKAEPMPTEDELVQSYLEQRLASVPLTQPKHVSEAFVNGSLADGSPSVLNAIGASLLEIPGAEAAARVLTHSAHGHYLGLQSALTADGAIGHDLRQDHEALFMQAAAVGVTVTLLATTATEPEAWPYDVECLPFLKRAVELTIEASEAATALHNLAPAADDRRPAKKKKKKKNRRQPRRVILRPAAVLDPDGLLLAEPGEQAMGPVVAAAEAFYATTQEFAVSPSEGSDPVLHTALTYGGAYSALETVMTTYDQPGGSVMAAFAARMLLEESARLVWRFAVTGEEFKARATQYFDEFRSRRIKTLHDLTRHGVSRSAAEAFLAEPANVVPNPRQSVKPGRKQLPSVESMLRDMGARYAQPGWLPVAYTLLSQITHSTPIGHLHVVRVHEGEWHGASLSAEMTALSLDTACLGAAELIGWCLLNFTNVSEKAQTQMSDLRGSAARVHRAASTVHGLDRLDRRQA